MKLTFIKTPFFQLLSGLLCTMLLLSFNVLNAQTTYTTISGGSWSSTSTWDANGIPPEPIPAGDIVNVGHFVNTSGVAQITNNGTVNMAAGELRISTGTLFTNNSTITVTNSRPLRLDGGDMTNSSTGTMDLISVLFTIENANSLFTNEDDGNVDLGSSSQMNVFSFTTTDVVFSNAGTFDFFGFTTFAEGSAENLATGIINAHSTFHIRNEGFINAGIINTSSATGTSLEILTTLNSSTGIINHDNRFLRGNGTIIIPTFSNNAVLIPFNVGFPGGNTLNITGNYDGTGQMRTFIKGTATTDYGRLEITGTADITQGSLWAFLSNFNPEVGDEFEIISAAGGVSGPFASTTLPILPADREWEVEYNPTTVVLKVVATCGPPVAMCNDITVQVGADGNAPVPADEVGAGSTAECGLASETVNPSSFTCNDLGDNTVTYTVMDENGASSTCTATVTVEGLPCGFSSNPNGINCTGGNMAGYDPATETYTITSEGCYDPNYYSSSDSHGYLGAELCGDGQITAEVTGITGSGWAGVAMRETLNAGSKMLQLSIDGVNMSKRELRQSTGGIAFNHVFQTAGKNWLRLTRSGNQFTAQHSSDGTTWNTVISTMISMSNCIEIGLFTENKTPAGSMTATFENVETMGNITINGLAAPSPSGIDVAAVDYTEVEVFPNPTSGEAFLNLEAYYGKPARVEVYNNQGQSMQLLEIDAIEVSNQRLDLSGYQSGLYFIKVQVADQPVITRKLMLVGQ